MKERIPSLQFLTANAVSKLNNDLNNQQIPPHLLEIVANARPVFYMQNASGRIKKLLVGVDQSSDEQFYFSPEDFNNPWLVSTAFLLKVAFISASFYSLSKYKLNLDPTLAWI